MRNALRQIGKWLLIGIAGLYAIFAIGLFVLNRLAPKGEAPQGSLESSSRSGHQMRLLSGGVHSFYSRLKLIEEAKSSIELEFFIYNTDEASRILTQALIRKAAEGVKVRLLVDFSAPVFQLKPVFARYLHGKKVEVRYYNTSAVYRLVTSQHRSHRKLLIVDGKSVITGGRNIGNEYFDLAPEYNFLDSDVEVRGEAVEAMRRSFDLYWQSDLSKAVENLEKPLDVGEQKLADEFFVSRSEDSSLVEQVQKVGAEARAASRQHLCRDFEFVTDFPGHGEHNRQVYKKIVAETARAEKSVVAESPYFVIRGDGYDVLKAITDRGVQLEILTNTLYSTDAFYTVATMLTKIRWLARAGLTVKVFDGSPVEGQSHPLAGGQRWGIHSKRAVIDSQTVLVGTYNIDPRSANLNSELMLICRNQPELAADFLADIQARSRHARVAVSSGEYHVGAVLEGARGSQLALTFLSLPLANLFDFLL